MATASTTAMKLLCSALVPSTINDRIAAVGRLTYSNNYVAVALSDTSVHVFSILDGSHKLGFKDPCGKNVWAHAIIDDMLVIGSADGVLRTWSILQGSNLHTIQSSDLCASQIKHLCVVSPDSNTSSILAAAGDGTIRQWIIGAAAYSQEFIGGHSGTVFKMQSFDNGRRFISVAWEGTMTSWDLISGTAVWKAKQDEPVYSFTVGEEFVVLGRRDGVVKVFNLEDGSEIAAFYGHTKVINGLLLHQNNLISTGTDGYAKVWSISASKKQYTLKHSIKLYDHAITSRCILGPWLITGMIFS